MKETIYSDQPKVEVLASGTYKFFGYIIASCGKRAFAYVRIPHDPQYCVRLNCEIPVGWECNLTSVHTVESFMNNTVWLRREYVQGEDCLGTEGTPSQRKEWTTDDIYEEVKDVIEQLAN